MVWKGGYIMPIKRYQLIIFTQNSCNRQFAANFSIEAIMKLFRKQYNITEIEVYEFSNVIKDYQYLFTIKFEKGLI